METCNKCGGIKATENLEMIAGTICKCPLDALVRRQKTDTDEPKTLQTNLVIGRFELYPSDWTPGMIWIDNGGEGAEFDQKLLEEHIAEFYKKYF